MKIGYIKDNKNINKKMEEMKFKANVEKIIFEEISFSQEKNCQNILLSYVNNKMNQDDVLVVYSLNELGKDIQGIIKVLELIDKKKIHIEILDEYFYNNNINIKQLISVLKWVENNNFYNESSIKHEVLKKAEELKGPGRPEKYSPVAENSKDRETYFNVIELLKKKYPIARISKTLNISRNTVYRIKKEYENEK